MAVICWTHDTDPFTELAAYKRAFEDERGIDVDHFELRCSPSFHRWMVGLPAMAWAVDVMRDDLACGLRRWLSPVLDGFMMLDNVRVISRDHVDGGEAFLSAIRTEERAVLLFTISAVLP